MSVYLDYAATAPLRPAARRAWEAVADGPANPASLHGSGRRASAVLEDAREQVAQLAGVRPDEVLFTSGGTESNAIALNGLTARGGRILVGATEHKSVLAAKAHPGTEVLPVDPDGRVLLDELARRVADGGVAAVAIMAANNETGAVSDLEGIAGLCASAGAAWHCDAVQWPATRDVRDLRANTIALSAHKVGGPVGVGALIARRGTDLPIYSHGGGQEGGVRSGTVNVAGAAAFAAAWAEADRQRSDEVARIEALRDSLERSVIAAVPDAVVNAAPDRLASHLSVTFPGRPAEALLMLMDADGVEVSTGAACSLGIAQPSHVLAAMGAGEGAAQTVRFSMGWASTPADVAAAAAAIEKAAQRAAGVR